ncbi:GNAT family N-acetyltransferase [Leisingera sp. M658]|uniref:GNAT family N-acetyltransferase n=1 Tax=Leisingera sp. M658 TaxID=2867015 RepID=UPI0021A598BB|nr:GNAT family N-acetyltransferase [Leisingera sp. M658]UWQ74444.1 GNAT family N-acetyltransferase [Leisingera sp. M658]
MQNKRGISQAFARPAAELVIRPATVFDVFAMSQVLIASIRDLCQADHGGDAGKIADWTANKSPAQIRNWIDGPGRYWLAERGGGAAAVGGLGPDGTVSLLYVSPDAVGQGSGSGMLRHLETELRRAGHSEGRLNATRTALGFYSSNGWQRIDAAQGGCGTACIPMRKSLL